MPLKPIPLPDVTEMHAQRFWSKVQLGEPDECWEWQAGTRNDYGVMWLPGGNSRQGRNGRDYFAHRIAFFLANKSRPKDLCVLHVCDNPLCVNPNHLRVGNHLDNMRDMYRKDRRRTHKGEDHHNAKLTWQQVREMRVQYKGGGITLKDLAEEYRVDTALVHRIIRNRSWKEEHDPALQIGQPSNEMRKLLAA